MATDEHYNEPGGVPPALEDHKPNDMPATRWMYYIIGGALVVFLLVVMVNHFWDQPEGGAVPAPTEQPR